VTIMNLTQHPTASEQLAEGVYDAPEDVRAKIKAALTFSAPCPQWGDIEGRAQALALIADDCGATSAMIGGLPALMGPLTAALQRRGIKVCFAFSLRESVEKVLPDGSTRKVAVFRHLGLSWARPTTPR